MEKTKSPYVVVIAGDPDCPRIELYPPYSESSDCIVGEVVRLTDMLRGENCKIVVEHTGPVADKIMGGLVKHGVVFTTLAEEVAKQEE